MRYLGLLLIVLVYSLTSWAQAPYEFNNSGKLMEVDAGISVRYDPEHTLSVEDISHQNLPFEEGPILNNGPTSSTIWISFSIRNNTHEKNLYVLVAQPSIDHVSMYSRLNGRWWKRDLGEYKPYGERYLDNPNYIFPLQLEYGQTKRFYIQIRSKDQLQIPLYIGTEKSIASWENLRGILMGIYAGIILGMMAYHFFIFISTKSQAYFFYVLFIGFVGLVQINFQGYAYKFLWPTSPWMALNSSFLLPMASGLMTALMVKNFLRTRYYVPRLNIGITVYMWICILATAVGLAGMDTFAIKALQAIALLGALYAILIAIIVVRKHYRPARFFLIAFIVFFICIIIFVLRNFDIVPYNLFTIYILEIGSVIQTTLLSFALADQINMYRREREISREQALHATKENERIVKEQNVILEAKVKIRTTELRTSNKSLEAVVDDLKRTQKQLVEAEKLASLGVLIAGIAHEINNPVNFVSANVRPLRRDVENLFEVLDQIEKLYFSSMEEPERQTTINTLIDSLKEQGLEQEINELIQGIEEGANRTAAIVKSLRIFSHADGKYIKAYNVNEGITSTLMILKSSFSDIIEVTLDLGELPKVECFPGKLNQSFMNIFSNAATAIKQKFGNKRGGNIHVKTSFDEKFIYISIKDNGVGIEDDIKDKIYDPFFTTQDVGEGVGLGLSIVYQTIAMHGGNIVINSGLGEGTEFMLELPREKIDLA